MARRESERLLGSTRIFLEPPDSSVQADGRDISLQAFRSLNDQNRLELRLTRRFLLEIFDVDNLSNISEAIKNPEKKNESRRKFVNGYCEMLGISGEYEDRLKTIELGLNEANRAMSTIEDPQLGLLRQLRGNIGTLNEVSVANDPMDLLCMCFSAKASRRMRYEARRKLLLGDLAIRSRLENVDAEKRLESFSTFLGENVWSSSATAKLDLIEILSHHSPTNYACTNIKVLEPGEKTHVSEFIQYHRLGMRTWKNLDGKDRKVMVEHRGKSDAAQVIKLLRKDTKNIGTIDDVAGFKMTFENKRDIYDFLEKLQYEANGAGTAFLYEEIYDTIDNGDDFRVTNPGSSKKLEIIKVHLRHNGSLIELQLHTLRSFIDSRLHDEYGFEEYALDRLFQKGKYTESVIDLLYPPDIYGSDISHYYEELRADIRENKRVRSHFLPKDRSLKELHRIRYSDNDLVADVSKIFEQFEEVPDLIVAVGKSGIPIAREVSMHLPGTQVIIFDPQNEKALSTYLNPSDNVLIVDDIGDQCVNIKRAKVLFPNAKVAVLGRRENEISQKTVDYFARTVQEDEFIAFTWDRGLKEQDSQMFALGIIWKKTKDGIKVLFEKNQVGQYKLPGGRVEDGDQDIETGFRREIAEETHIKEGQPNKLIDASYQSKRNLIYPRAFVRFYEMNVARIPQQKGTPDPEVDKLEWIDISDALTKLSTPEFKEPFEQALKVFKERLS